MGRILSFLLLILMVGCGSTQSISTEGMSGPAGLKGSAVVKSPAVEHDNNVALAGSPEKELYFSNSVAIADIMNFLASDALKGRDSGSEGIAMAADFIETIFKSNHIEPYFASYRDTLSNFEKPAYNMVGYLEGTDPKLKNEFIILGAHYDHIGMLSPVNGDAIANGANDNASGSTTVLELARYFGGKRSNKRSIIFALFSAEEQGLLGSKHLAERLKGENLDLYAMLNFEMVGVPLVDKDYLMYLTGYELSNLAEVSNGYSDEKIAGYLPKAKEINLFKRSDNFSFHNVFNVPSQTYSTYDFSNFEHYHKVGDEAEKMNFTHMANIVNKLIPVMEGITNAPNREIKYN